MDSSISNTELPGDTRSASDVPSQGCKEKVDHDPAPSQIPRVCHTADEVVIVRRRSKFTLSRQRSLRNSLLPIVGYLELANAGDFAANVWNDTPVPTHAIVLMALGGIFAIFLSIFAFQDARLSWLNVRVLREERRALREERAERIKESQSVKGLDVVLDVLWRELGTEIIDRFGMDIVLGGGAIVIGCGTLLAIDGADKQAFYASNLLTGYIGNAPIAFYGLMNVAWGCYIWRRTSQHKAATLAALKMSDHPGVNVVRRRARRVQLFLAASALNGLFGGAASLMTATLWQGYIILAPVIIASIVNNMWWRRKVGYDRPRFGDVSEMDHASLLTEINYVTQTQKILEHCAHDAALSELGVEPNSLGSVLNFLKLNDLFEGFALAVLRDSTLSAVFASKVYQEVVITTEKLENSDKKHWPRILELAKEHIKERALQQLQNRERYLAEAVMCYMYFSSLEGR